MDQLEAVRTFIEVAESESFTVAADRLGISKGLVSKRVSGLEARVGALLLNRSTRQVSVTETGAAFLERARGAVAAWEAMMEAAMDDQKQATGLLRVAGPKVFGETALVDLVADFMIDHPKLRVDLAVEEQPIDIVGGGFDLAVSIGEREETSIFSVLLCDCQMTLCASPAYLAVNGTPIVPVELARHACIVNTGLTPTANWPLTEGSGARYVAVNERVRVNNESAARAFVRAGLGVGLLMRRPIEADLQEGRLVEILNGHCPKHQPLYALLPQTSFIPQRTRLFLDHLKCRLRSA